MDINIRTLQDLLCSHLCSSVRIIERGGGVLMLDTPFSYPDGDHYPIYIQQTSTGGIKLSDGGHTFMHLSYENEVSSFRKGTRGKILDQILGEMGLHEMNGEFFIETSMDGLSEAIFCLGQGLTKVYDIIFLNRARVSSTFYEDLFNIIVNIIPQEKISQDYIDTRMEQAEDYPIDYSIRGKTEDPLFVFGVPNSDKARLTTITLERLLRYRATFDSILVFADQQEIPRKDLARLTNVGGEMVSSLDARDDLSRKILRKAA